MNILLWILGFLWVLFKCGQWLLLPAIIASLRDATGRVRLALLVIASVIVLSIGYDFFRPKSDQEIQAAQDRQEEQIGNAYEE